MKRFFSRFKILLLVSALVMLCAVPFWGQAATYWDGLYQNCLVKGYLYVRGPVKARVTALTGVTPTGYSISSITDGMIYEVNPDTYPAVADTDNCPIGILNKGVTVFATVPTANSNEAIFGVRNIGTGGTPFVVQITGALPIQDTSGTTTGGVPDAQGDIQWFQLRYNNPVSGYLTAEYVE